MSEKKYLVVNADDFGLSRAVCDGVVEALDRNNISDLSIISNGVAFEYGVRLLKERHRRSCGVHLCFIDKELPLSFSPSWMKEGEHFHTRRWEFLLQFAAHYKAALDFLKKELETQIEKVLQAGLAISHVDGHQHLHILPGVSALVVDLCRRYQIPFVRIPEADRQSLSSLGVQLFSNQLRRLADQQHLHYVRTFGFKTSGHLNREGIEHYLATIRRCDETAFELMTHPGFCDEEVRRKYSHWGYSWERELQDLRMVTKGYLQTQGVELVSFDQLAQLRKRCSAPFVKSVF